MWPLPATRPGITLSGSFARKNAALITAAVRRDLKDRGHIEFATLDGEAVLRKWLNFALNTVLLGVPFEDYCGIERLEFPSGIPVR